jgi:hypothetical protein
MTALPHISVSLPAGTRIESFLVGGWVGGPSAWPPRLPDLNTLDVFLWCHLKLLVYLFPVDDVETL